MVLLSLIWTSKVAKTYSSRLYTAQPNRACCFCTAKPGEAASSHSHSQPSIINFRLQLQIMEKLLRSMTSRRKARHSVAAALSTSAAVPNSGFVFVDNSQGGSAAVGELSHALDTALDGIEGDFDSKL